MVRSMSGSASQFPSRLPASPSETSRSENASPEPMPALISENDRVRTFPLRTPLAPNVEKLILRNQSRSSRIRQKPEAKWTLELIAKGELQLARNALDRACVNQDDDFRDWSEHVENMLVPLEALPAPFQKVVESLVGNALEKRKNATLESLDNMHRDMLSLQRFVTGMQSITRPFAVADGKKRDVSDDLPRSASDNKPSFVAGLLLNGRLDAVREALEDEVSIERPDTVPLPWVAEAETLIALMDLAFTEDTHAFTQSLLMNLKAGDHQQANEFIAHAVESESIEPEFAAVWAEAASKLAGFAETYLPAPLESRKKAILASCLTGQVDLARSLVTSLHDDFLLEQADVHWANMVSGVLADMETHPFLKQEIRLHEIVRKGVDGADISAEALDSFLGKAGTWIENFGSCARNLKQAVMPFVKNEELVSLHETQKAYVAGCVARDDYSAAAMALTEIATSADFDQSSKDWIKQCSFFIGDQKEAPASLSKENKRLKQLVRDGNPSAAEQYLDGVIKLPSVRSEVDQEHSDWADWAARSIHFVAVPLLLERIHDEIDNDNIDLATHLVTELIQFSNDQKRTLTFSPEVESIIRQIKAVKNETAVETVPEAVRPSIEPDDDAHPGAGIFLSADGKSLIDAEMRTLLEEIHVDSRNRLIKSNNGSYLAHYSSDKGGRLHADDRWLGRLPPLMNVARTSSLMDALKDAMNSVDEPRNKPQNSFNENMAMLKRVKEQARFFRKEGGRFNPKRIGKKLIGELDIGEIVDGGLSLFSMSVNPFNATPGQLLNRYGKVAKNALTVKATGIKEEYEATCTFLESERLYELEKLHPMNRQFCEDILEEVVSEIRKFSDEIRADDQRLQIIDAKLEWHQRVLSINHFHPVPVSVDRNIKKVSLAAIPFNPSVDSGPAPIRRETGLNPADEPESGSETDAGPANKKDLQKFAAKNLSRDDVALCFNHFEKNHSGSAAVAQEKKVLLFHGTGGTGKSYDSRRAGFQIFDDGKFTKQVPPVYYSVDGLVKLPKGNKPKDQYSYYDDDVKESVWLQPPEKSVGVLADWAMQGFRIFVFEEGEKIVLPQGRKSKEVEGTVKYIFDPDTTYIDIKLDKHEFRIPWDRQMFLINSNKNLNKMGLPEAELRALMRRFNAKVEYIEASPAALKSAFEKNLNNTLALGDDQGKAALLRKFLKEKEIDEHIIRAGREMGPSLATPDTVGRATSVIVNSLLDDLNEMEVEQLDQLIDFKDLCALIDMHWKKIAFEYEPAEAYDDSDTEPKAVPVPLPMPMPHPSPPPLNINLSDLDLPVFADEETQPKPAPRLTVPVSSGNFYADETVIRRPRVICNAELRKCNESLSKSEANAMNMFFLEQNCINEITKRFLKSYTRDGAGDKSNFIDRAVLRNSVRIAHAFYLENHTKDNFRPGDVLSEVHKVFRSARYLMSNESRQRQTCLQGLLTNNEEVEFELASDIVVFFHENNIISQIMRNFTHHGFSTEDTLKAAVAAAHRAYVENHLNEEVDPSLIPSLVSDAIETFFSEAADENAVDVLAGMQINRSSYGAELSYSEMSDSDDPENIKKWKLDRRAPDSRIEVPAATPASSGNQKLKGQNKAQANKIGDMTLNLKVELPRRSKTLSFRRPASSGNS